MSHGFFNVPVPRNEPVLSYAPGSTERIELKRALDEARSTQLDIPMNIGGERVRTEHKKTIAPPHDHKHVLGHFYEGESAHVEQAINAALSARRE